MIRKSKNMSPLDELQELAHAFQRSRVLFTAIELDVFSTLGANEIKTADQLAKEIEVDSRALTRLLNALCALNLLDKDPDGYKNNERFRNLLVKGQTGFIGDLLHISNLWEPWSSLTDVIKHGSPIDFQTINEKDDDWIKDFTASTHWKSKVQAESIVKQLDLRHVEKVLDLGCGSGHFAAEFLRQKPSIKPIVFDYPRVIACTKNHLKDEHVDDKIEFLEGDMLEDGFGSGYDLVFISNVINEFSIWDNVKILQRVFDSMNRGGWVAINEIIIDDDRTYPVHSALYALNMLVNTLEGDSYTETDIWIMLRESWFTNITRIETEFETTLMLGKK